MKTMKDSIVGLILFLMITSVWAGTLRDNFDDGNLDGWRKAGDQSAQWSVKDGELVSVAKNICDWSSDLMIGDDTWKDYEFEAQFKIEQTFPTACRPASLGVGIRYDDTNGDFNGATVWVATAKNQVAWQWAGYELYVEGNLKFFAPGKKVTGLRKWYTMRILAEGERFAMFIDDEQIVDFQADIPEKGAASVFAANAEVHFDNIVISGDEIPNTNMGVEPEAKLATTWGEIKDSN